MAYKWYVSVEEEVLFYGYCSSTMIRMCRVSAFVPIHDVDPGPALNNIISYILPKSTPNELKFCLEIAFIVLYYI